MALSIVRYVPTVVCTYPTVATARSARSASASGIAGYDHLHGQVVGAGALRQHGSRIHARQVLRAAVDERAPHPPGRGVVEAARDGDGHVIALDLAELDVDDVPDRVVQAEADEHQRRAAADADDGHEEAPLVAQDVARADLPGERHAPPQRADMFQQDAPAGLGRLGRHERGGTVA
ncbi:hypothetical protein LF912_00440 [Bifidobacterium longum]|uniref:hypothetical protein n=1 Tax=Bifidobacterium longum TaxID=216816 RepID=UPI001F0DDE5B|nr:hypothetical protein [Bifidobacterium longum]MCH4845207.1 hypothetical protein [Bifidobacterium longum]